jgi:hypothetical protein
MGGSSPLFSLLTSSGGMKMGERIASAGMSDWGKAWGIKISDKNRNAALDPLNISGVSNPTTDLPDVKTSTMPDLDAEAKLASEAEADRTKKRKGYKSTVLTSMGGDLTSAGTLKQTLGGA